MKRGTGLALALAVILGLGVASVQAGIFKKWPSAVSTGVTFNYGTPIVFGVTINGQGIIQHRTQPLNDLGGIPRNGAFDSNLAIDVEWIETVSGQAYSATFEIPVNDLASHEGDGDHVDLTIRIGGHGAIAVETPNQDMLLLLHSGQEAAITPQMDEPVRIAQSCADPVAAGTAQWDKLQGWIDEEALAFVERNRGSNSADQPDPLADLGCGGSQ